MQGGGGVWCHAVSVGVGRQGTRGRRVRDAKGVRERRSAPGAEAAVLAEASAVKACPRIVRPSC